MLKFDIGLQFFIFFLLLFFSRVSSQNNKNDFSVWYVYNGGYKLNSAWSLNYGAQFRNYDFFNDPRLRLYRFAGDYTLKNFPVTFGLGYMFLDFSLYNSTSSKVLFGENRIYQYILAKQNLGRVKMDQRLMLEERWRENRPFVFRYRYRLRLTIPVQSRYKVVVSDELFISSREPIFDANRFWLMTLYNINKNLSVGPGWIFVTQPRGNGENYVTLSINHTLGNKK
ncbi:MAG: DUF2490 domain-containing protein [Bergeyella sp.]|nr:DUF2490 domain-containing protein [Bergeyella sp.]